MSKALLVGNGFTSQLIPSFGSSELMKKMWEQLPKEMRILEDFFQPFRTLGESDDIRLWRDLGKISDQYASIYDDEEDTSIGFKPDFEYSEGLLSTTKGKYLEIIHTNYPLIPDKLANILFDRYFVDAKLFNETKNDSIKGIESPLAIAKFAVVAGVMLKETENRIKHTTQRILFNCGTFRFADCRFSLKARTNEHGVIIFDEIPSKEKLLNFLHQYSFVFTTNYDLILDDLVYRKVRHLHGGFNFKSAYERVPYDKIRSIDELRDYCIITAGDSIAKERAIYGKRKTLFSKYLECLAQEKITKLFILGYSGDNDNHINQTIKQNSSIEKVYYFAQPDVVNRKDMDYIRRMGSRFWNKIDDIDFTEKSPFVLLPWNEFWDYIKQPNEHKDERGT